MTHNVKSELRRSMDAIHFSGDDKERMVALLMSCLLYTSDAADE